MWRLRSPAFGELRRSVAVATASPVAAPAAVACGGGFVVSENAAQADLRVVRGTSFGGVSLGS